MKIISKDGNEYNLYWIEEKDGNIISIKDTERSFVNKSKILQIVKYDPEPMKVSAEWPLQY